MNNAENRTYDGSGNNQSNPTWGQGGTPLLRMAPSAYADNKKAPAVRPGNPNPRVISNLVCSQSGGIRSRNRLTDFVWAWGQFLDHELDLTPETANEELDIDVPTGDPDLPGGGKIAFKRSIFENDASNTRQQINLLSSYIDASNVYGANQVRASGLRLFDGTGRLKFSIGPTGEHLLPYNTMGFDNAMLPFQQQVKMFVAGDVRCNEHNILTCMHTLFMREHNRLCLSIIANDITLEGKDEIVYQRARKIVGALMQVITFNEFLPALLGPNAIPAYTGYDPTVNASIMNVFSTASYRLGHSMVSNRILLGNGEKIPLRRSFFSPRRIELLGIEPFLEGAALQVQQEMDTRAVDGLRSFLFFAPDTQLRILNDLAALNIQRGRDHGLPDYNTVRHAFGLGPKSSFGAITSDPATRQDLKQAYNNDINAIDPWVGGLAEDHVSNDSNVGELINAVLTTQFSRLRDGDRFWYQNDPALDKIQAELSGTLLSDIIKRNTRISNIRNNVFVE
jgi:hypothetical protein